MASRRRQAQGLERVLGTPALFSTAYGDVGSSIYYALGLTALYALGLTPVVFVIAGIFFIATATTYAEGTVRFPEAGGSSSFARHAFNEVASFGAAWSQLLNYMVTISISAFFVPHYLAVFWAPLRTPPWDIVGGATVIVALVLLNVVGVREAVRLNVVLAVIDFTTQLLLVAIGAVLIFHPHKLVANVHLGLAPHWSQFFLAIPIAMIAYTGMETISNLAEETRDPTRDVPRAYRFVAGAVFAIYLTLPAIALMALPVTNVNGHYQTKLGLLPAQGGYQADPVLGLVDNLGLHGILLHGLRIYVGLLAATILIIAANAGVIGSSRITYAMASYRQIPEIFRRLHPRFKTPWLSLLCFSGVLSIATLLPGKIDFLGTMYSFGAMLSFAIANASLIGLRMRFRDDELLVKGRPNLRLFGIEWPLFAIVGFLGTAAAWLVVVIQRPDTRLVGFGWLAAGFTLFVVYRLRVLRRPLRETIRAPIAIGPAIALEYTRILVPLEGQESLHALDVACKLAADKHATVVAVTTIEVPVSVPLDAPAAEDEAAANEILDAAATLVESYGVRFIGRIVRTRNAGRAIVDESTARNSEIIVVGDPRRRLTRRSSIFGATVDFVLRHAPCRVMVAAAPVPRQRGARDVRRDTRVPVDSGTR
jgi:APA family basic amino acid/polyamine antiporter